MRSTKPIRRAALLLTMLMPSCTTLQTSAPAPGPAPSKTIPCVSAPLLHFHAPTELAEVKAWIGGTLADPKNGYDTPETAAEIRRFDAARAAVCGP